MGFALIAHVGAGSTSGNSVTTGSINTTGANLIVLACTSYGGFGVFATLTDSNSNTWTQAGTDQKNGLIWERQYYCYAPTVGAGHTFTLALSGSFMSICVSAWSGAASSPLDQTTGSTNTPITTIQPGSITPSNANSLVIISLSTGGAGTVTINSSCTISDQVAYISGQHFGCASAYIVQGSASPINPTWTFSGSGTSLATTICSFIAASGGGTPYTQSVSASTVTGNAGVTDKISIVEGVAIVLSCVALPTKSTGKSPGAITASSTAATNRASGAVANSSLLIFNAVTNKAAQSARNATAPLPAGIAARAISRAATAASSLMAGATYKQAAAVLSSVLSACVTGLSKAVAVPSTAVWVSCVVLSSRASNWVQAAQSTLSGATTARATGVIVASVSKACSGLWSAITGHGFNFSAMLAAVSASSVRASATSKHAASAPSAVNAPRSIVQQLQASAKNAAGITARSTAAIAAAVSKACSGIWSAITGHGFNFSALLSAATGNTAKASASSKQAAPVPLAASTSRSITRKAQAAMQSVAGLWSQLSGNVRNFAALMLPAVSTTGRAMSKTGLAVVVAPTSLIGRAVSRLISALSNAWPGLWGLFTPTPPPPPQPDTAFLIGVSGADVSLVAMSCDAGVGIYGVSGGSISITGVA